MKKDLLLFAAFIFGVATTAGAAKSKAGERIDTLKARQLQEVQVISTRASKKAPLAFTNVSKNDIQAVNYGKDIPYLLALTPSITLTSDAGNGIGYTTLRVRGTDPSRVNITANGIPMNDAESSSLFWVNFSDFASSTQSIQIQRGVGTSTNGAGAFGATVNMLTDNIGAKPYVGLDVSGGSYYSHKETVRFSTGLINDHGVAGTTVQHRQQGLSRPCISQVEQLLPPGRLLQRQHHGEVHYLQWSGGNLPCMELHIQV